MREELTRDPQSRRAILTLHGTHGDLRPSSLDQPCLTTIQFLIRKGHLHCIATMRSNDAIWGLCYDAYFITMLQELLCAELGLKLGWYQHVANSIHIYKSYYEMARAIVAEEPPSHTKPMSPMTDVGCLPKFLSIEEKLRLGDHSGFAAAKKLPKYWRELAKPLIAKRLHQ